jgi:hypothetical protein
MEAEPGPGPAQARPRPGPGRSCGSGHLGSPGPGPAQAPAAQHCAIILNKKQACCVNSVAPCLSCSLAMRPACQPGHPAGPRPPSRPGPAADQTLVKHSLCDPHPVLRPTCSSLARPRTSGHGQPVLRSQPAASFRRPRARSASMGWRAWQLNVISISFRRPRGRSARPPLVPSFPRSVPPAGCTARAQPRGGARRC